ncbi:hypothetical protein N0V92_003394 [Colletotrichum tropicale]|nr:hypothetical protein N0V92_003394 [Colletotrichum tropicale]
MLKNDYQGYIPQKDDVFDLQLFGVARAHELALTLQWLYDQPESSSDRHGIWEVMDMMWQGSRIMDRDWTKFFGEDFPKTPSVRYKSLNFKHGVNVAQESAAFNAVPAGISADWWSHQYITQVNQPWAKELELPEGEKTPFYDVCRYANVFGLEPEFDSSEHVHKIDIPAAGDFDVFITIHAEVRVQKHENSSVSIHYGPLLYAYEIDFKIETRLPHNYKDQASDCTEISSVGDQDEEPWMTQTRDHDYLPTADWNIAIDPTQGLEVVVHKGPWEQEGDRKISELPNPVWNSGASPVHLEISAAWVSWPTRNGTAADPVDVERKIQSQPFRAKLVPYATAKLHIAQFPVIDNTS